MPEISRFYGIIITMYWDDHLPPLFHVIYNELEAVFDINEGVFIRGALPSKQARLVLAWYELHKEELIDNWNNIASGKSFKKIAPLA